MTTLTLRINKKYFGLPFSSLLELYSENPYPMATAKDCHPDIEIEVTVSDANYEAFVEKAKANYCRILE